MIGVEVWHRREDLEGEKATRRFRNPESIESERVTRAILPDFLNRRGYTVLRDERVRNGQTIVATDPNGEQLSMRVRICWRRDRRDKESNLAKTFAAAQLMAQIGNGEWVGSLRKKIDRERSQGVNHLLIVQNEDEHIVYAALVPLSEVVPIWIAQRDTSSRLIADGRLGRRKKNHAMNGVSPPIWLQDDRAPEVAQKLWSHPGVLDLAKIEPDSGPSITLSDEEGDRSQFLEDSTYTPTDEDQRREVERQIRERRGQQHFRDLLRDRYGHKCLVTGCRVLAVVEAAHVKPYRGENDNHPENGLLLRSDIHTLFDLDLLGIEPDRLEVKLHPSLIEQYGDLAGIPLACGTCHRPSYTALRRRYEQFQRMLHLTT